MARSKLVDDLEALIADGHRVADAVQRCRDTYPNVSEADLIAAARKVADRYAVFTEAQPPEKRTAISANLLRIQRKARQLGDLELEIEAFKVLAKVEGLELDPGSVVPEDEKTTEAIDQRIKELIRQNPQLKAKFSDA